VVVLCCVVLPRGSELTCLVDWCRPGAVVQVDSELESYHKSNAELDLLIGTLRQQLDEMQTQISGQRFV
jgi:hypothetical protein